MIYDSMSAEGVGNETWESIWYTNGLGKVVWGVERDGSTGGEQKISEYKSTWMLDSSIKPIGLKSSLLFIIYPKPSFISKAHV